MEKAPIIIGIKNMFIQQHYADQLSKETVLQIQALITETLPPEEVSPPFDMDAYYRENRDSIVTTITMNEKIIAHCKTFPRTIRYADNKTKTIIALADVCVKPGQRGNGIGKKLISFIFDQISKNKQVCLFQTDIPEFYESIGAKKINNTFINSSNTENPETNPWWNQYVMIYPDSYNWFEDTTIDLNGTGY